MTVEKIINQILAAEGERFTNDPADSGGPTKWGITQAALSNWFGRPATATEVANLKRETAFQIYQDRYFVKPGFNRVMQVSPAIAEELTDTGVNCGPSVATIFLQRCLNAFNLNGTKYPDLKVDGDCGPRTLAALKAYMNWRGKEGETVMLRALNCLQGERYIDLAEKRPKDEKYVYGWLLQRVSP